MSLRKARAAIGATAEVEAAAEEVLGKGNAVDAVVAGVFAACATSPGVLLGPVQILASGGGAGALAIDGRVRQPGLGAPRPRGFVSGEDIPDAARVGVPWLPAALSVAIATVGSVTFAQALAPAIAYAKGTERLEVLKRIASRGPRAMEERPIGSELLAFAGRPSGGLLTPDDLAAPHPDVLKAQTFPVALADPSAAVRPAASHKLPVKGAKATEGDPRIVVALPWAHADAGVLVPPAHCPEVSRARAVMAVDRNGGFAIAVWDEPTEGMMIPELGLRAPFFAEPVRRGQTRTRPGEVRAAAAAIGLVGKPGAPDVAFAAFGAADAYDVLASAVRGLVDDEQIAAHGEARLAALLHAQGTASAFRS